MPKKAQARGGKRGKQDNKPKPISGLDVDALLQADVKQRKQERRALDPRNAIPEFSQMVEYAEDVAGIEEAVRQMGGVIRALVTDSFGDGAYDRAVEHLGALRARMIQMEEPDLYNAFLRDFKTRLLAGELGGNRKELWWTIRHARMLGLIDSNASEASEVTPEEAAEVSKREPTASIVVVVELSDSY